MVFDPFARPTDFPYFLSIWMIDDDEMFRVLDICANLSQIMTEGPAGVHGHSLCVFLLVSG